MAEKGVITASIVVNFDAGGKDGILNIEVDDRPDGLNKGQTSFAPGDEVGLLVYKTSNVVIDEITCSLGSIKSAGSGTREIEEFVTFAGDKEASAKYPIMSGFSYKWYGRSLGGIRVLNEVRVQCASLGVGAAKIKYTTNFLGKKLTGIPLQVDGATEFPVVVYVVGHIEGPS